MRRRLTSSVNNPVAAAALSDRLPGHGAGGGPAGSCAGGPGPAPTRRTSRTRRGSRKRSLNSTASRRSPHERRAGANPTERQHRVRISLRPGRLRQRHPRPAAARRVRGRAGPRAGADGRAGSADHHGSCRRPPLTGPPAANSQPTEDPAADTAACTYHQRGHCSLLNSLAVEHLQQIPSARRMPTAQASRTWNAWRQPPVIQVLKHL